MAVHFSVHTFLVLASATRVPVEPRLDSPAYHDLTGRMVRCLPITNWGPGIFPSHSGWARMSRCLSNQNARFGRQNLTLGTGWRCRIRSKAESVRMTREFAGRPAES